MASSQRTRPSKPKDLFGEVSRFRADPERWVRRVPSLKGRPRGLLSRQQIKKVMQAGKKRFQRCLRRLRARFPQKSVVVEVEFVVGPKGRVWENRLHGSLLHDPRTRRCLRVALRRLRFPRPTGYGFVLVRRRLNDS